MVEHWTYKLLKKFAMEQSCNHIELEELKNLFQIDSTRRRECIKNTTALLDYLERLDLLSETNVEALEELADYCGNTTLLHGLHEYCMPKDGTSNEPVNQYRELRLANEIRDKLHVNNNKAAALETPTGGPTKVQAAPVYDEAKRRQIYKLLAQSLGSYWRRFGRELEITEGAMDEIELRFTHDLSSRIHAVLKLFEEDSCHDPRQELILICRALEHCQRKDLRRKVENIISHD